MKSQEIHNDQNRWRWHLTVNSVDLTSQMRNIYVAFTAKSIKENSDVAVMQKAKP